MFVTSDDRGSASFQTQTHYTLSLICTVRGEGYCSWVVCLSVSLSVSLCVCPLVSISRLECLFVMKWLSHTQQVKLKLLCCRDLHMYTHVALSALYSCFSSAIFHYV